MENSIKIRGARVHNLKDLDLDIPLGKMTLINGPSGSGKSSLAFHTLHAESKRRFINSFPNSVKFFIDRPPKVDVDDIGPVLAAFGLPQVNPVQGGRSIIADTLGLSEKIQALYFAISKPLCPEHLVPLESEDWTQSLRKILVRKKCGPEEKIYFALKTQLSGPSANFYISNEGEVVDQPSSYWGLVKTKFKSLDRALKRLEDSIPHDASEVVVSIPALGAKKRMIIHSINTELTCPHCDYVGERLKTVQSFSPYNALGACPECRGFGETLEYDPQKMLGESSASLKDEGIKILNFKAFRHHYPTFLKEAKALGFDLNKPISKLPKKFLKFFMKGHNHYPGAETLCSYLDSKRYKRTVRIFARRMQSENICHSCHGARVREEARLTTLPGNLFFKDLWEMKLGELQERFSSIDWKSTELDSTSKLLVSDIKKLLSMSIDLEIDHLKLKRKSRSIGPGQYQRLLLAKFLSYDGTGSLFVFDEPTLGLDEKEQKKIIKHLKGLCQQGNTVVVVDHSEVFEGLSDHVIHMGPGSGQEGGRILTKSEKHKKKALLGSVKKPSIRKASVKKLVFHDLNIHDVSHSSFSLDLEGLNWVHGPSGSGKTAFFIKVIANEIHKSLYQSNWSEDEYQVNWKGGVQDIKDCVIFDFKASRGSSRSTVATLTGLSSMVKRHFASLEESKRRGLNERHFGLNGELSRCHSCEGAGETIIEMQYLEDVIIPCDDCQGLGMKHEYAQIQDQNLSVYDAYSKPFKDIVHHLKLTPKFKRMHTMLSALNLDYLGLARTSASLSGGERQRLSLLSRLEKPLKNSIVFIENISFGLSKADLFSVATFLKNLTHEGNTLVIIDQSPLFKDFATREILLRKSAKKK